MRCNDEGVPLKKKVGAAPMRSRDAVTAAMNDPTLPIVADTVDCVILMFRDGHKILLVGYSGSAGDAQQIAGELLPRLYYDYTPVAAIAMTTDSSVLTAIGNDTSA